MPTYFSTLPTSGVSFYTAYPPALTPQAGSVDQLKQIGWEPGTVVLGNLNTKWVFALNGATALAANAAANIDPVAFTVGGTGGVAGHSPIPVPANAGAWFEISGATLVLTAASETEAHEAKADAAAHGPPAHAPAHAAPAARSASSR